MIKNTSLKIKWDKILTELSNDFADGEKLDIDGVIFLIGIQELGVEKRFKKDEKINLMHIAICRLLEPYGYYKFVDYDEDGWPHYEEVEKLPNLKPGEQTLLMKEAIIHYFDSHNFFQK